jgi:hypothetical protein
VYVCVRACVYMCVSVCVLVYIHKQDVHKP